MQSILQIGLEGSGSTGDLLLAVFVWVGVLAIVLILGKLFDTYIIDIWQKR
jgi:hypothetical protein